MKNIIRTTALLSLLFILPSFSQEKIKFGQVSTEELEMSSYTPDPEAPAVVLHEERYTHYEFSNIGLFVENEYMVRIKIFSNDGFEYANGKIDRYVGRNASDREVLSGLTGYTHHLENGKAVRTKLSKEHIFEEKISERMTRTKFALPKVSPGSVVEYKYAVRSPYYTYLNDCVFQREIPVRYSIYTLSIPEYFQFNKQVRGGHHISFTDSKKNETALIGLNNLTYTSEVLVFETKELPALKDEKYVWCTNDFKTKVEFELRGITIPGSVYKSFTNTWENVDKQMIESSQFGKQFNHKLFKDELKSLLADQTDETAKLRTIYHFVRSKIQPNDTRTIWAESPKNALKKGSGSSAEINAVLLSALNEAGFDAYPVVLSLRGRGRIPVTHPTIDNLNYFIACVDIDGKPVYMDAASKYGDLNVLPTDCLVDFARNIGGGKPSGWIDLSRINQSTGQVFVQAAFNEEGILEGSYKEACNNQLAYAFRQQYAARKDRQEHIDKLQTASNIQLSDLEIEDLDNTDKRLTMAYRFTRNELRAQDDFFYFNPLIFATMNSNPFQAEHRSLPIEFSFPYRNQVIVQIKLPAGYQVDELPKPTKIVLGEKDASFQYNIQYEQAAHQLSINMAYQLSRIVYRADEYEMLRNFYTHIATQNNSLVTLKKASETSN